MSFFILALGRVLRLLFLSHTHYFSIAWVLCLLFLPHTHYISRAWVSRLLFLPHTHYISRAWVSRLLFLSHTHYNYLARNHIRIRDRTSIQQIGAAFVDGGGCISVPFIMMFHRKKGAELMLDSLKLISIR